jgi:hypothetical protein
MGEGIESGKEMIHCAVCADHCSPEPPEIGLLMEIDDSLNAHTVCWVIEDNATTAGVG